MKRLLTLDEHNYSDALTLAERYNVRAVIVKNGRLAMERSKLGEFKFPGGSVDCGETFSQALSREVREETGLVVIENSIAEIGEIYEKRLDLFDHTKIYSCYSLYYSCQISDIKTKTARTASEVQQGYKLCWAEPDEVIKANQEFLNKKWIARDTKFLEMLLGDKKIWQDVIK